MGARLVLCKKLNVLAVAFRGMLDFRLGDLKKQRKGSAVDLDKSTLRAWRSKHDAKMQRASVTSTGQTEEQQESPTASAGGGRRARSACEARWRVGLRRS
ncbi:hypothetical protein RI054_02g08980 [Pseudoscourfieldia marina]